MTLSAALSALSAPAIYVAICAGIFAVNRAAARPIPRKLLLAYFALPFILFSPTFIGGKTFIPTDHVVPPWPVHSSHPEPFFNPNLDDIVNQLAPWQLEVSRAWRSGSFPWRFPWSGCGTSLAANSQSAAFSPLAILSAFVPISAAFSLQAALKILAVLLGCFLFLRELDLSTEASVFGSAALGLGMVTTVWIFYPAGTVACTLPLSLFLVERALTTGATRRVLSLLAMTILFAAVNGHPETLAVTLSLLVGWTIVRPNRQTSANRIRAKALVAWALFTGAGLAGFILKPEYDSIAASSRRAKIIAASYVADRPWLPHAPRVPFVFASLLMPTVLGDGISSPPITEKLGFFDGALGYAGVVAIGAALAGLLAGGDRRRTAPLVILVASCAIASQAWPVLVLTKILPLLKFINPARYLLGASLGIGILAAIGIDQLVKGPRTARAHTFIAATCALTGLATFCVARFFRLRLGVLPLAAGVGKVGWLEILTCFSAAGFLLLSRWRRWPPRVLVGLLTILASGELLAQASRLYRVHEPSNLFPPTPLTSFLNARNGASRVIGIGPVLFPNSSAFVQVRDVRTHDPMEREDYTQLLCAATNANPRDYFQMVRRVDSPYLNFLSVRFAVSGVGAGSPGVNWKPIYSEPDGTIFENSLAEPLVTSPTLVRNIPDAAERGNALDHFGLPAAGIVDAVARGETLLLASARWQEAVSGSPSPVGIADVRERENEVSFSASNNSAAKAGVAVASLVQDGGWTADDERGKTLRTTLANGPFLAIAVPAGAHRINLTYRPPGLAEGLAISCLALVSLGLLMRMASPSVSG